jgi:hypothetical protein
MIGQLRVTLRGDQQARDIVVLPDQHAEEILSGVG